VSQEVGNKPAEFSGDCRVLLRHPQKQNKHEQVEERRQTSVKRDVVDDVIAKTKNTKPLKTKKKRMGRVDETKFKEVSVTLYRVCLFS
jgi:hypothetical protein